MLYNLLVARPAMYWPSTLVVVQLFTTLYDSGSTALSTQARQLTRRRLHVFLVIFLCTFIYQFLPMLLFPTLTTVSVLCLIDNSSWWMRTLGGAYTGLGMLNFSFDWSSIGTAGPLYTPYWALGNWFGGLAGMIWVVSCPDSQQTPAHTPGRPYLAPYKLLERKGLPQPDLGVALQRHVSEVRRCAAQCGVDTYLGLTSLRCSSPTCLSMRRHGRPPSPSCSLHTCALRSLLKTLMPSAITYGLAFAALSSIMVHVWLWHRQEIKEGGSFVKRLR